METTLAPPGTYRPPPPRPKRLRCRMVEHEEAVTITRRTGVWAILLFLSAWMAGWSIGSVALTRQVLAGNTPVLFAIPFWVAWVTAAAFLIDQAFGRETLFVSPEGVDFTRRYGLWNRRRLVTRDDVVRVGRKRVENDGSVLWGIEITTASRPVLFGMGLPEAEQRYLRHRIERVLNLPNHDATPAPGSADSADAWPNPPYRFTLREAAKPLDTRLESRYLVSHIEISERGRWNLGVIAGSLFINLFWNGIVSIFVLACLFGDGMPSLARVGLGLFLLPFVAIGLFMSFMLLTALAGPAIREAWVFHQDHARHRITLLGVPLYTRRSMLVDISAVEIDCKTGGRIGNDGPSVSWRDAAQGRANADFATSFVVRLIDGAGSSLTEITGRTHGEARWVAAELVDFLKLHQPRPIAA